MRMLENEDCTTILSLAKTSVDGKTRLGQCADMLPMTLRFAVSISVDEKTGIKVISCSEPAIPEGKGGPLAWDPAAKLYPASFLSSCGVAASQNLRGALHAAEGDPDVTLYSLAGKVLQSARTAKEAIEMAEKIAQTGGVRVGAGGSKIYADKDEAYMIEGYGPGDYAITGPMKDLSFAHANTIIAPSIKHLERSWPSGIRRMQRAQELLDQRGCYCESIPWAGGQITTPYFFRILRDHKYGFDATYSRDDRGNISWWGCGGRTAYAMVNEISEDYPDLLSIWWATPNFPPLSPFIPFFTGVTNIPPTFAVGAANETEVFQKLVNTVRYNLGWLDEVQEFWEAFDGQTVREVFYLTRKARELAKAGDRKGTVELLYKFTSGKCELAVTYAKALMEKISENQISVKVDVFHV